MKILIMCIFIAGQAAANDDLKSLQSEALAIVHEFQHNYAKYYKKKSPNISVRMVSVKELMFDDSITSCERTPKIMVSVEKNIWLDSSNEKREYLILHQLGHCVLNRTNERERLRDIPLSIMSLNNNIKYFKKYRNDYVKELFTKDSIFLIETIANER
jgi:hypothetical protein